MAQAEGSTGPSLYGYAQVLVNLIDQNDNTPKFTQQQYSAVVWEGNNKGTFVMQVRIINRSYFSTYTPRIHGKKVEVWAQAAPVWSLQTPQTFLLICLR